jgi:hypothetical protein
MSYLEPGKGRFTWITPPVKTSLLPQAGCVQCGSSLDSAVKNLSGKCLNCESWVSDEDESFEDLED